MLLRGLALLFGDFASLLLVVDVELEWLLDRWEGTTSALMPEIVTSWLLRRRLLILLVLLLFLHLLGSLDDGLVEGEVLVPVLGEASYIVHLLDEFEFNRVVDDDLAGHDHSQIHHPNQPGLLQHVHLRKDLKVLLHIVRIISHFARDQPNELSELELTTDFEPVLVAFQLEEYHLFFKLLLLLVFLGNLLGARLHKDLPIKFA